jgi:hypothetical protein
MDPTGIDADEEGAPMDPIFARYYDETFATLFGFSRADMLKLYDLTAESLECAEAGTPENDRAGKFHPPTLQLVKNRESY